MKVKWVRVDLTMEKNGVECHDWAEVVTQPYGSDSSVTYTRKVVRDNS